MRQYEEVLALRQQKEEAIRQAQQSKEDEKRRLEEQSVAEKLTKLRKRMGKAKGEILLASTSQGSLLITESLYQVDRLKILETYTDQLDALRAHRLQCKYCGELLNWRDRLLKRQVHAKKECQDGWSELSQQMATHRAESAEFMRAHAALAEEED